VLVIGRYNPGGVYAVYIPGWCICSVHTRVVGRERHIPGWWVGRGIYPGGGRVLRVVGGSYGWWEGPTGVKKRLINRLKTSKTR